MRNKLIRTTLRCSDVKHWELAEQLGVSEATVCRWLRTELPEDKTTRILQAIEEVKAKREQ